jgi:hypothetical protein
LKRALLLSALVLVAGRAGAVPTPTPDDGIRLTSASFQAATGAYPALRMFTIWGSSSVLTATTTNGRDFVREGGVRLSSLTVPSIDIAISSITGLAILPLNAGGFRMAYSVVGTTGAYRIYSATSADGLAWANDTGSVVNVANTFAGYPSLIELGTGDWRLYYIQDLDGGNNPADYRVFTALSTNEGRNWSAGSLAHADRAGHVAATQRTDQRVRLYYTQPVGAQSSHTVILSALSSDTNGTIFAAEAGIRASTNAPAALSAPFVIRSTDAAPAYRWRLYYTVQREDVDITSENVVSAMTQAPDPLSVSPSIVYRNQVATPSTVLGEIFPPTANLTAQLEKTGEFPIAGAGVAQTNDQTFVATFDTQGAALGAWDLRVTNTDNGFTTVLPGAVTVDFPGGSADVTDNLFRPRLGGQARVTVTTFNSGRVTLKVFSASGALIRTLADGDFPAGTIDFLWDGRDSAGGTVASGLYVIRTTGPKLSVLSKVVVIK